MMVTKTIRSTKLATILIKAGCKLENIRPNKNDRTKTVFIFIDCPKFQKLTREFFKEEVNNNGIKDNIKQIRQFKEY